MKNQKFRGLKQVHMVTVLEGNGKDEAYRDVYYIFDGEQCIGRIDMIDVSTD